MSDWRVRLDPKLKVFKELEEWDKEDWDYVMQNFLIELRRPNGDMYPPATIKGFVTCIQFKLQNFFNKNWSFLTDAGFIRTHQCIDAAMKLSAKEGFHVAPKRARTISLDEEEQLWTEGKFGMSNPKQLVETLLYHLGLHLSLRACGEHRDLVYGERSQLQLVSDVNGEFLLYTERMSKNAQVGVRKAHVEPKITRIYPHGNKERCVIEMYKRYISHRPESFGGKGHEAFYLTPLKTVTSGIWYRCQPMGVHTIETVVKRLLGPTVDPTVRVTNSSLRRTSKTRLLDGGVSKELASMKTGRISDKADRAYIDVRNSERLMSTVLYGAGATPETETAGDRRPQAQAVVKGPADAGGDKACTMSLHQEWGAPVLNFYGPTNVYFTK